MSKEIRRVAYVTTLDSADINNWSGIMVYLHDALASVFPEVVRVGPLKSAREPIGIARRLMAWSQKKDHPLWLTKASAKSMAKQVDARLEQIQPDVVFSVWHPQVAYLKTTAPVFMFQDSPFEIIQPLYSGLSHFTPGIMQEVCLVERLAAKRCTGIIETSDWAANEARKLWDLPYEKVASIPFGANVKSTVTNANLDDVISGRSADKFYLLWLGKDWERKGGDIALDAVRILNERGIPAVLRVVGCDVSVSPLPSYVEALGFVDKGTPEGVRQLDELLRSSHALILPTQSEAFGIVFLEAAAYGSPSLAPDVMGVGSAVLDGLTGCLLSKKADGAAFAQVIEGWARDRAGYEALCKSAYRTYHERFTWDQVGLSIRDFIKSRI